MTSEHTPPVDLSGLLPYWKALIDCDSAECQELALQPLISKLSSLNYHHEVMQHVRHAREYIAHRQGLLGFYIEARFPEDIVPHEERPTRRFIGSFTTEQEPEMIAFLEAWIEAHYHGRRWYSFPPTYGPCYFVDSFQVFSVSSVREDSKTYAQWKQGFSLMAEREAGE